MTDLGFAVGLVTHKVPKYGCLVWFAEPAFDEAPDLATASEIAAWRWPVFFPLGAALHRHLVTAIGVMAVPPALETMPRLRGGGRKFGWTEVTYDETGRQIVLGPTADTSMAVDMIVNDTMLKEMLVSG